MDIEVLTKSYRDEDEYWSIEILLSWLEKKGVPTDIAQHALQLSLLQLEGKQVIISTHHGPDGFDQYVFKIAKELMTEIITAQKQIMADSLNQAISSHLGGNRISKIWRILRGKL